VGRHAICAACWNASLPEMATTNHILRPNQRVRDLSASAFWIGLIVIVCMGSAIRFYGLSDLPIWMDEAYSYFVSGRPLSDILFNKVDNHPPLFYAVQHFWTLIDPSIKALRVPAAMLGIATIFIVALTIADLIDRKAALASAAFLALSTGHIYFSQDARMYSLLALGLAVATWGLLGFLIKAKPSRYLALYLIGAAIAVYSQVVALPYLALLNGLVIICLFLERRLKSLLPILSVNLILLGISLPWLLSLKEAIGSFQGLAPQSIRTGIKFFRNLVGFPGLSLPFNLAADAFMILIYVSGGLLAWKNGWRTFVLVVFGLLVLYPLTILALSHFTPILSSRIFIPCAILASMLFGMTLVSLRRPLIQSALLAAVLSIGIWSDLEAIHLRTSPEDVPQVLEIADDRGFNKAPILACYILPAATASLYAPDRVIVFLGGNGNEFIRFDSQTAAATSLPMKEQIQFGPSMREFLIKNSLFVDPEVAWASYDRVILMTTNCWPEKKRFLEQYLRGIGFKKNDTPAIKKPKRDVIDPVLTEFSLWSRSERSAQGSQP
jgi:hypothetical protein